MNQKHSGGKTGWPLSHCAGRRRRERGFPWHRGPNTIPALSKWQTAAGGRWNSVAVYLCGFIVASLNGKCSGIYLHTPSCGHNVLLLQQGRIRPFFLNMPMLSGIISYTTNCLSSYQPLVIWELRFEGWLKLKGDGKCCLKWIRKAAGFIFTRSVTCAAKRKQVTEECVPKPQRNTRAQMICCHSGRSAFLKICFMHFPDLYDLYLSLQVFLVCPVGGSFTVTA